jgi:16S rRNA (guanine527-N7)-methyltransferase
MQEAARSDAPARTPLPEQAEHLPPLGPEYQATLDAGLAALLIGLAPEARRAIEAHARLLQAWTDAINLTAIREPAGIALLHVIDSLAALPILRAGAGPITSLLDLGSGSGYPGIPLAVTLGVGRAALVDSVAKRTRFLSVAAAAAVRELVIAGSMAPSIAAVTERAENLAHDPPFRERWDVVTIRAVGSLAEIAEMGLPLVGRGGRLMCWKRDDGTGALEDELAQAAPGIATCGGGRVRVEPVEVPGLEDHRLVVISKVRPTPGRFPRSPAERRRALLR